MATIKELESELAKAKKAVVRLSQENVKLSSLLAQVEPALAQANSQVEELRSAVDDLTSQKVNDELNLKAALDQRDMYEKLYKDCDKKAGENLSDLRYEKQRRVSAENKLYELEKQVFKLASNHETLEGVRAEMRGHRIDRHGEIA